MLRYLTIKTLGFALCATFGAAMALPAQAENLDYHTTYATAKNACKSGATINWSATGISGPGFECTLGESAPAGSGLANYPGSCVIDNQKIDDAVTFDLGNNPDRFEVALPGRDWMPMYPCTPVEGLDGTN